VGLRTLKQFESGKGNSLYSTACLRKVFSGKKISPFLNYSSSISGEGTFELFKNNRKRISISGVQEKFYIIQEKTT
jgi:serine/threonine-protein kinase HipA